MLFFFFVLSCAWMLETRSNHEKENVLWNWTLELLATLSEDGGGGQGLMMDCVGEGIFL